MKNSPVDLIAMAATLAWLPADLLAQPQQPTLPPTGDESSLLIARAKASAEQSSASAP